VVILCLKFCLIETKETYVCLSEEIVFEPQNSIILNHKNTLQAGSYNTTRLIQRTLEYFFTLTWKKVAGFGNDTLGDKFLVNVVIFHSTNICRK